MDDTDHKLLAQLQMDARISATTLAKLLGVSRGTVQNLIYRLVDQGVIQRFTLEFGPGVAAQQVSAFALVRVTVDDGPAVVVALRKTTGVIEVSTLSGAYDLVVELRAATLSELDTILDRIRAIVGVAETHSNIRLSTVVRRG